MKCYDSNFNSLFLNAAHTGVDVIEVGSDIARTQLTQRPETENHIASQHAGAMFTLGEAASGAAMAGAFLSQIASLRPVAANAQIKSVKVAKGTLTASANVGGDVAEMSVDWYLSHRRS